MKNEFGYLLTAVMYFTRIPGIRNAPHDQASQQRALKFFPLIGWLVGALGAITLSFAAMLLPVSIAVIAAVSVTILLTGAMHEDGLADSFDAFGGGLERDDILRIMKDSHLGAYGVIALLLIIGLKLMLLFELTAQGIGFAALAMMFAQATSRFAVLLIPASLDYVRQSADSKSRSMVGERFALSDLLIGSAFIILPLFFFGEISFWLAAFIAILSSAGLGAYFKSRIGGYSGDCLGATQQISEVLIYLTLLVAWTST
jgi:adenosylcobinamide-GDP ribazoletransferase